MDLFKDSCNFRRALGHVTSQGGPRTATERSPRGANKEPPQTIFDTLTKWSATSTVIKHVAPDRPHPHDTLPALPPISFTTAGSAPTFLPEPMILKFAVTRYTESGSLPSLAGTTPEAVEGGMRVTRIQRYEAMQTERRERMVRELAEYCNALVASLHTDITSARIAFQGFLTEMMQTYDKVVTDTSLTPFALFTEFSSIGDRLLAGFESLAQQADARASTLTTALTQGVRACAGGLAGACCTGENIREYLAGVTQQSDEHVRSVISIMRTFVISSRGRTDMILCDYTSKVHRVMQQRRLCAAQSLIEGYLRFLHRDNEYSTPILVSVSHVQGCLSILASSLLNFVTALNLRKQHPRDYALQLVSETFLPAKAEVSSALRQLDSIIAEVGATLQNACDETATGLESIGMMTPDYQELLTETLNFWCIRWRERQKLIAQVCERTLQANSFYAACVIALLKLVDDLTHRELQAEKVWRSHVASLVDAIEARFSRDWARASECLAEIGRNIGSVWNPVEAGYIKAIASVLTSAMDDATLARERSLSLMASLGEKNLVVQALDDTMARAVAEIARLLCGGSIVENVNAELLSGNLTEVTSGTRGAGPDARAALRLLKAPGDAQKTDGSIFSRIVEILAERGADNNAFAGRQQEESVPSPDAQPSEEKKPATAKTPPLSKGSSRSASHAKEPQGPAAPEDGLLIPLPDFDGDINLEQYTRDHGFSFGSDCATPDMVFEEISKLMLAAMGADSGSGKGAKAPAQPSRGAAKKGQEAAEQAFHCLEGLTQGVQQLLFTSSDCSNAASGDSAGPQSNRTDQGSTSRGTEASITTGVCIAMPRDPRSVLHHALLAVVYDDGKRRAFNDARSDFLAAIEAYRVAYLERMNESAREAYRTELAAWEKAAAQRAKQTKAPKQKGGKDSNAVADAADAADTRPLEPVPATELPQQVKDAIAGIRVPLERPLADDSVYLRCIYAILEYDGLTFVPPLFTSDQQHTPEASAPTPKAVPAGKVPRPRSSAKKEPPALPSGDQPEDDRMLGEFRLAVLRTPCYAVPMSDALQKTCVFPRGEDILRKLYAVQPRVQLPGEPRAASAGSRARTMAAAVESCPTDPLISELLGLPDPSVAAPTLLSDTRIVADQASMFARTLLANITTDCVQTVMSRYAAMLDACLNEGRALHRRVTAVGEELRLSVVPYRVRFTSTEIDRIVTRNSRYNDIMRRTVDRVLILLSSLQQRYLEPDASFSGATALNRRLYADLPARTRDQPTVQARPPRAATPVKSGRGPKEPAGDAQLPAAAQAVMAKAGLSDFVEFTYDASSSQVTSIQLTDAVGRRHPLMRATFSELEQAFAEPLREKLRVAPVTMPREVLYACSAYMAHVQKWLQAHSKREMLDVLSGGRATLAHLLQQAETWGSARHALDFHLADKAVALLRGEYAEAPPLVADVDTRLPSEHPSVAVAQAMLRTVDMAECDVHSRIGSDMAFFRRLCAAISQTVQAANTPNITRAARCSAIQRDFSRIRSVVTTRTAHCVERAEAFVTELSVLQHCTKNDTVGIYQNFRRAAAIAVEAECLLYNMSYDRVVEHVFFKEGLAAEGLSSVFIDPFPLFQQRAKGLHAWLGMALAAMLSVLALVRRDVRPFQEPVAITTEARSRRSRSPLAKRQMVTTVIDYTGLDVVRDADFAPFAAFCLAESTYAAGAKTVYGKTILPDLLRHVAIDLEAAVAKHGLPRPARLAEPVGAPGSDADEGGALAFQMTDLCSITERCVSDARRALQSALLLCSETLQTVVVQFARSVFDTIAKAMSAYTERVAARLDSERARILGDLKLIYDMFRPILAQMPDKARELRASGDQALKEYRDSTESILQEYSGSIRSAAGIACNVLVSAPSVLLGLYPLVNSEETSFCASVQICSVLDQCMRAADVGGDAAGKQPKSKRPLSREPSDSAAVVPRSIIEGLVVLPKTSPYDHLDVVFGKGVDLVCACYARGLPCLGLPRPEGAKDGDDLKPLSQPPVGKDTKPFMSTPTIPAPGDLAFLTSDATRLEVVCNTEFGSAPERAFAPLSLGTLTANVLAAKVSAPEEKAAANVRPASRAKDDKVRKDAKPKGPGQPRDECVPPQAVMVRLGVSTLALNDYAAELGMPDSGDCRVLVGAGQHAIKQTLGFASRCRSLLGLLAADLQRINRIAEDARALEKTMSVEFTDAMAHFT